MHQENRAMESTSRRGFLRSTAGFAGAWTMAGADLYAQGITNSPGSDAIDAHAHIWSGDIQRYPLKPGMTKPQLILPNFMPEELLDKSRHCGVRRIVLIQISYYGSDNACMLDAMRANPGVFSGVARIDGDQRPRETMLRLARQGVRGIRLVSGKQPADRWLGQPEMAAIWQCAAERGLVLCALTGPEYFAALDAMCRKFPETTLALDHLGHIGFERPIRDDEVAQLCGLARHRRVCVKLSGFYALGRKQRPYLDLAAVIRRLFETFGPQRLMWGSDSPFQMIPPHRYRDSIELIRNRLDFLGAEDRQWLLRKTAERLFF
jgi:predicted TIM-barrel fold metal-dependent hydrolase